MTKRAKACSRKAARSAIRTAPVARSDGEAGSIRQSVSVHGITPAVTPGAISRNATLPRAALALGTSRGRLVRERAEQLREALGLVLGNERVGVLDSLELRSGNGLREAL